MSWLMLSIGVLFITLGILIKYAKWYWLIAGYNTASPEEKRNIDIVGFSHTLWIGLLTGGIAMIVMSIIVSSGSEMLGSVAMLIIPFVLSLYLVWKGQKFTITKRNNSRKVALGVSIFLAISLLVISAGILYSCQPAKIKITPTNFHISGIYGLTEEWTAVEDIQLLNETPKIQWKTNGFSFGNIHKGNFTVDKRGNGKLFMHSNNPPCIYLKTADSYILLNYSEAAQTKQVFEQLYTNWKNGR